MHHYFVIKVKRNRMHVIIWSLNNFWHFIEMYKWFIGIDRHACDRFLLFVCNSEFNFQHLTLLSCFATRFTQRPLRNKYHSFQIAYVCACVMHNTNRTAKHAIATITSVCRAQLLMTLFLYCSQTVIKSAPRGKWHCNNAACTQLLSIHLSSAFWV